MKRRLYPYLILLSSVLLMLITVEFLMAENARSTPLCPPRDDIPHHLLVDPDDEPEFITKINEYVEEKLAEGDEDAGIIVGAEPKGVDVISWLVYQAEANKPINFHFAVRYASFDFIPAEQPLPVRFFVLLNEQFLDLEGDGNFYIDRLYEVKIPQKMIFQIPPLEPGLYDLVIVGIPNYNAMPGGAFDPAYINHFIHRATLAVGEATSWQIPSHDYTSLSSQERYSDQELRRFAEPSRLPIGLGIVNNTMVPSFDDTALWWVQSEKSKLIPNTTLSLKLSPGEKYQFNLRTHYTYVDLQDERFEGGDWAGFALIGLQDYRPVPINEEGTPMIYRQMYRDAKLAVVPMSITAPVEPGLYSLVLIKILYPGMPLCRFSRYADGSVEAVRLPIEVVNGGS